MAEKRFNRESGNHVLIDVGSGMMLQERPAVRLPVKPLGSESNGRVNNTAQWLCLLDRHPISGKSSQQPVVFPVSAANLEP